MRRMTAIPFVEFIDVIFCVLFGLILALWLVIQHINPEATTGDPPPGEITVEIKWDDESEADIDLWLKSPGDTPVGYSRKAGLVWNLLRDDRGHHADLSDKNYENAYTRGTPDGEYIVNLHYFSDTLKKPVEVDVKIWLKSGDDNQVTIHESKETVHYVGHEITVVRWRMIDGLVDITSIHKLPVKIRSAGGG